MRIANKLLACFVIVGLTPLIVLGYGSYTRFEEALKEEVLNKLIAIADDRVNGIDRFIVERERDIVALAHTPAVIEATGEFEEALEKFGPNSPEYEAVDRKFRTFSTFYRKTLDYHDFFLFGAGESNGNLVFTDLHESDFATNLIEGKYKDTELAKVFDRTRTSLQAGISAFKYYEPSGMPAAFFAAPVMKEGKLIGVAALQTDTDGIYQLASNFSGLGNSGETVLAFREKNRVTIAAPLRHDPLAAFKMSFLIGSDDALPIQAAVQGERGHGLSVDYRGKKILAAWRYLPRTEWGIVVKIDIDEAYARVYAMRNRALLIGLVALTALVCASLLVSKSISRPIGSLKKTTELMAAGDLAVRTDIRARDEIGALASAFDGMAGKLQRRTKLVDAVNKIFREALACETVEEVARTALGTAEELTGSKFGFIGIANERNRIGTMALSDPGWSECRLPVAEAMSKIEDMEIRGIWGDVILKKEPLIANEPWNYPGKVGIPEGHPELTAFLGVPLRQGEEIFGLIALANKPGGYGKEDRDAIEVLSVAFAEALKRKTEQVELRRYRTRLEELVEERTKKLAASEEKLKELNRNLVRSNKELEQFAYVASHDLQEPLRMVASYVQLIERRYKDKLDRDANEFIAFAVDGANRMKALINDLLAFSRIETRGKPLESVSANSALEETKNNLKKLIEESGAVVSSGKLPDLRADKSQIVQLFQNLISNAIKYSGDRIPEIEIDVQEKKAEWLFSVKDNGIGIDPQFFNKIFVIFQQLHRKGEYSGTGIGLAICKRIVERHGGRIWVESAPGQGSTFFFALPR